MKQFSEYHRKCIRELWNRLKPLRRTRVFGLPKSCLFVFHSWNELNKQQKATVLKMVWRLTEEEHHKMIAPLIASIRKSYVDVSTLS